MQALVHLQIRPWLEESGTESVDRHVALISHEERLLGGGSLGPRKKAVNSVKGCLWSVYGE